MEKICKLLLLAITCVTLLGDTIWVRSSICHAEEQFRAASKAIQVPVSHPNDDPLRIAGHRKPCVLLKNNNLLFGEARQVGAFVIVKTREGSEIRLQQNQVLCWAETPEHLYRYRVDHRQKDDVQSLIRDVRWCIRYGLYDLAAYDLLAVRRLAPNDAAADLLEQQLRNQWEQRRLNHQASPVDKSTPQSHADDSLRPSNRMQADTLDRRPGSGQGTAGAERLVDHTLQRQEVEEADNPVGLRFFASHIQPMLVNRCGVCHATGATDSEYTGWQIMVPPSGSRASAVMTRENLLSTRRFVDDEDPEVSRLYRMATEAHGGRPASLTPRNAAAMQSLSRWILSLKVGETLSERASRSRKIASQSGEVTDVDFHQQGKSTGDAGRALAAATDTVGTGVYPAGRMYPARLPLVHNPFDPQLFNRRRHLQSSNSESKSGN